MESISRAYGRLMNLLRQIIRVLRKNIRMLNLLSQHFFKKRSEWVCPVIHMRKLTKMPSFIALPLLCGRSKGMLKCPPELTILLIHNYKTEPIMEKSLRYTGIDDFVALKPKFEGSWVNTIKLVELKRFLDSGACSTEYILYCDSDDAVLRDDPAKAIEYLREEDCDLLLSNTGWKAGYECMPEIKKWADQNAKESGRTQCYINSGVYVGRTEFLRSVVDSTLEYITDHDLPRVEYWRLLKEGTLCETLPEYPKGVGSDQVLFRYVHPQYYPRMKIDYKGRLALR